MSPTVRYHRGPNNEFSLAYATPDPEQLKDNLAQYSPPTRVITTRRNDATTPVYLVHSHSPTGETTVEIPDHPFVHTMIRVFAGVVDGRRERGEVVRGNKTESLDAIPEVLTSRVDWKQPVPTVGGQLLSNLILTHALPNANHRTSLGMLLVYLQTVGVDMSADDLANSAVDAYIMDSKRLLTVRRNATKFRILNECGFETIERKGGIQIPLGRFDLSVSDPYAHFAAEHERRSIQFTETLLDDSWRSVEDPGLRTFLSRLSVTE